MQKPFWIGVVGPTASGKTAAAVALAKAVNGEVISMDAMQIYRRMDIGTAKPSLAEREGVVHHMLDVIEPGDTFSVAVYREQATSLIAQIAARGRLPILAGGTGLYLNALLWPLQFAQTVGDEALRAQLQAQADQPGGREALHQRLAQCDPQTADRLHPNDVRRVIRALEICMTSGRTMSEMRTDQSQASPYDTLLLGITLPRAALYRRIEARVDHMVEAGLVQEVEALLQSGISCQAQSMQAIGYKETVRFVQGACTFAQAVADIKQGTRHYAKRQMTWFRKNPDICWWDAATYESEEMLHCAMIARARQALQQRKTEEGQ